MMSDFLGYMKSLLEFVKHFHVLFTVIGVGGTSGLVGWWVSRQRYKKGDFTNLIEFVMVKRVPGGVKFHTIGPKFSLEEVFPDRAVRTHVIAGIRAEKKSLVGDGILKLADPTAQRHMMGDLEDHLTGNDPRANSAGGKGRDVNTDTFAICPTFKNVLGDDTRTRVFVIDDAWLPQWKNKTYREGLEVNRRFGPYVDMLGSIAEQFACASDAEDHGKFSVWIIEIDTAKTDVTAK
jgi:hypothetical protein